MKLNQFPGEWKWFFTGLLVMLGIGYAITGAQVFVHQIQEREAVSGIPAAWAHTKRGAEDTQAEKPDVAEEGQSEKEAVLFTEETDAEEDFEERLTYVHTHSFTMVFLFSILLTLFLMTGASAGWKKGLILTSFGGILGDLGSFWMWSYEESLSWWWGLLFFGSVMVLSFLGMWVWTMKNTWKKMEDLTGSGKV